VAAREQVHARRRHPERAITWIHAVDDIPHVSARSEVSRTLGFERGEPIMKRSLMAIRDRRRARAEIRRKRALKRAVAEMERHQIEDGSIWRSGKGGAHHDR
jgi:hypothetical protein